MTNPLEIIQDHYAASARGDLDGMVARFAPDLEWIEMAGYPYGGTYVGPDAVVTGVFKRIGDDWDNYQAVPDELLSDGDHVVAFGRYSGTFKATGTYMEARFVHHWQVRDGQVVWFEQYTDTHLVRQAMGRTPGT